MSNDTPPADAALSDASAVANPARRHFGSLTLAAGLVSALPAVAAAAHAKPSSAAGAGTGNIDLVRRVIERGFNQGDLSVADEASAQEVAEHEYLAGSDAPGPEMLKAAIRETRKAVRDLHLQIEEFVEIGDKVWTRSVCRGVESSTGKPFTMAIFDLYRFKGGKIVEHWGVPDRFAMLHQVGLLPGAASGGS